MPGISALDRHFHFAHVGITNAFVYSGKIILNGIANVLHRFLLSFPLRPATGKCGAIHRVTFFRLMKHDLISEAHCRTLYRERHKLQRTLCRPSLLAPQTSNPPADGLTYLAPAPFEFALGLTPSMSLASLRLHSPWSNISAFACSASS